MSLLAQTIFCFIGAEVRIWRQDASFGRSSVRVGARRILDRHLRCA